ncbi:hypothetical protein [Stenotrophomonas sp. TWI809]|uniref:hypothetical protein n=1 Tax=Stenotrophomonas sp. TWI809 TaxID=3136796 RepID=UPI0032089A76
MPSIACDRIRLYTTFPQSTIDHGPETDRHTIKQLSLPGLPPLILGLAHLPSKLHSDDFDQLHNAMYFRSSIEEGEESFRHQNTIAMGDFNMNPFDPGMISAGGLNAVPCAEIAKKINRTVNGKVHDFFYNPTWNLLGDFNQPTGSYYHASPSHLSHYWNMLDQVVLRPSIASMLIKNSLQLITNTGTTPLIDPKGRPLVSDHLPLSFSLNYN